MKEQPESNDASEPSCKPSRKAKLPCTAKEVWQKETEGSNLAQQERRQQRKGCLVGLGWQIEGEAQHLVSEGKAGKVEG